MSRRVRKVRKVLSETEKSVETWHFWQILTVCLDLDWELVNVITVLDQDFSICWDFWAWSLEKVLKKSRLCWKISKILDKSRKSRFVLTISICLDNLKKYLDKDKSRQKNLDFKNLEREKKKVDLGVMDILDSFQKLVSTRRTISILISIGLDCRDPHAYLAIINLRFFNQICEFFTISLQKRLQTDRKYKKKLFEFYSWK